MTTLQKLTDTCKKMSASAFSALTCLTIAMGLAACTNITVPSVAALPQSLDGNWEFVLTPATGSLPFTAISGFIYNNTAATSGTPPLTATFQMVEPSSCFVGAVLLPFHGTIDGPDLSFYSFPVHGQNVGLTVTVNATDTQMSGTYSLNSTCANYAGGTLVGTKYAFLAGTYVGSSDNGTADISYSAHLTQNSEANGEGVFGVTGSIVFTGISCFTAGQMTASQGGVIGSTVHLTFTSNESGSSQVQLVGTLNPMANVITLQAVDVVGGGCAGPLGPGTLTLD